MQRFNRGQFRDFSVPINRPKTEQSLHTDLSSTSVFRNDKSFRTPCRDRIKILQQKSKEPSYSIYKEPRFLSTTKSTLSSYDRHRFYHSNYNTFDEEKPPYNLGETSQINIKAKERNVGYYKAIKELGGVEDTISSNILSLFSYGGFINKKRNKSYRS